MQESNYQNAVKWRRDLHQIPELALELPETVKYLQKQILDLNQDEQTKTKLEILDLPDCHSSFAVWLDFGKDEAIAFRTDMDALPVTEKTGLEFSSKHPGCMHACGHDGHMTNMLLLADALRKKSENPNNVLLIFQAGEETPGGAKEICKTGIFQERSVKYVFGLHLWPMLAAGQIATRPVELMARASEITITISGKSSHVARYKEGIDAMEAGAEMLLEMYRYESSMPENIYRLLRFGRMEAGSVRNAVASSCVIEGSLRTYQDEVFEQMKAEIARIAGKLEADMHVSIGIHYSEGYPAVLNDETLCERIFHQFPQVEKLSDPEMIAEDFAFYQREVPGVFFFLGTGTGIPLHSDNFLFDENILLQSAALFEQLAGIR